MDEFGLTSGSTKNESPDAIETLVQEFEQVGVLRSTKNESPDAIETELEIALDSTNAVPQKTNRLTRLKLRLRLVDL